jgi:hypothetical protein
MRRTDAKSMREDSLAFRRALKVMTDEQVFDALYGVISVPEDDFNLVELNDQEFKALMSEAMIRLFDSMVV